MKQSLIERIRKGDARRRSPNILLRGALVGGGVALLVFVLVLLLRNPDVYRNIEEMTDESRFAEAEKLARQLHEKNPLDVRALLLMGRNYFRQAVRFDHQKQDKTEEGWELYKQAVESLKKAILLDKAGVVNSGDYFILGFAYLKKGEQYFDDALQYLRQSESFNSNDNVLTRGEDPIARYEALQQMMGYLYYQTGKFTNALQYYRHANRKPNVLNYAYIGLCELGLGRYTNAFETFRTVRDYANQEALKLFAIKQLAWIRFHLGDYEGARKFYAASVEIDTNYAEGFYWLGKMEELKNDHEAARRWWQKSIAADPHFGPAILKLRFSPQHRTNARK